MEQAHTVERMKDDLEKLGVRAGDTLLVHFSYKALGGIENGAQGVFDALTGVLGEDGTLIVPALSYDLVNMHQPVFDLLKTGTNIGYLPEYFRTRYPGVKRSLHATHSCCVWGRLQKEMTEGHELDGTPVGPHSPFAKLPLAGGKILMLGCSCDHITMMHGVEETVTPPYLFSEKKQVTYTLIDGEGRESLRPSRRHHFMIGDVKYGQKYERVLGLLDGSEICSGKILDADSVLMDAAAVWKKGREQLRKDIMYFVEPING